MRKRKEPPTIHLLGEFVDLITGNNFVEKYIYTGNPIISMKINGMCILNTLIDLGAAINIIIVQTMKQFKLSNLHPSPTILELANRSKVKLKGVLDDVIVSID